MLKMINLIQASYLHRWQVLKSLNCQTAESISNTFPRCAYFAVVAPSHLQIASNKQVTLHEFFFLIFTVTYFKSEFLFMGRQHFMILYLYISLLQVWQINSTHKVFFFLNLFCILNLLFSFSTKIV